MNTILAAILLALSMQQEPNPFDSFAMPIRVIFPGHSTTLGAKATPACDCSPEPIPGGFVSVLRSLWNHRGHRIEVINAGCSGAGIPAFLIDSGHALCHQGSAWEQLVEPELPADVFVTMFNGGVLTLPYWSTGAKLEADYRALIARANGVWILNQHNLDVRYFDGPERIRFDEWREAVENVVASEDNVFLGADLQDVLTFPADFDVDQVHPNFIGHQKIAVAIDERIRELTVTPGFRCAVLRARRPNAGCLDYSQVQ